MVYVIQVTVTACEQDQDGTAVPSWSCSQAVSKPLWHIPLLCVQWKTPDDGHRNCPKRVEFYSKNKFEKLVLLVGFIIRIYHNARSPERQIQGRLFVNCDTVSTRALFCVGQVNYHRCSHGWNRLLPLLSACLFDINRYLLPGKKLDVLKTNWSLKQLSNWEE